MDGIAPKDLFTVYISFFRVWDEMEQSHVYKPPMAFIVVGKSVDNVHWLFIRLCIFVYCVELIACVLFGWAEAMLAALDRD